MTYEERKGLLIKELCSRLPYSLKVKRPDGMIDYVSAIDIDAGTLTCLYNGYTDKIEKFIPYLRTMLSMTKEEEKYYNVFCLEPCIGIDEEIASDWLNAHHFDYRGLIEKGLAIEVTEENNPYKE